MFFYLITFVQRTGKYDYDVVVIGGGSGGLACSKEGEFWNGPTCFAHFIMSNRMQLQISCIHVCCFQQLHNLDRKLLFWIM